MLFPYAQQRVGRNQSLPIIRTHSSTLAAHTGAVALPDIRPGRPRFSSTGMEAAGAHNTGTPSGGDSPAPIPAVQSAPARPLLMAAEEAPAALDIALPVLNVRAQTRYGRMAQIRVELDKQARGGLTKGVKGGVAREYALNKVWWGAVAMLLSIGQVEGLGQSRGLVTKWAAWAWLKVWLQPIALPLQFELLKRSTKLMGMYINRVNGHWSEQQQWALPIVTGTQELAVFAKSDQMNVYKADVM